MALELLLLRHAEAEPPAPGLRDEDRPLSRKGREVMEDVAAALSRIAAVDLLIASPYRRAIETAEFVRERYPAARLEESRAMAPGADIREILADLHAGAPASVLLVGHQPHLGRLLGYFLTSSEGIEVPLRKACAVRLTFSGGRAAPPASLRWVMSPRLAERIR